MYRTQNRLGGNAPIFGIMVDWLGDPYQTGVLSGVVEGAAQAGANLLCFVGGTLPGEQGYSDSRSRIYELAGAHNVDAIILLSSTLCHQVGQSGLASYCERFRPLPLCSIGVALPGIPSVVSDNEGGMRSAVAHLIRDHGRRRIAFVRGPLANAEAEIRFSAYRSVLRENGLSFDERLVVTGTFMSASGHDAVQTLAQLKQGGFEDLDAIVAANDGMALGVLRALEERDLAVPDRIAVVGFDDVEDARLSQPPLTTVRQPLNKQGRAALRILLEWLQHGTPPKSENLGTELVTRGSCGCSGLPTRSPEIATAERNCSFEVALMTQRQQVLGNLTRAARGSFGAAGPDWEGRLLNALVSEVKDNQPAAFLAALQNIIEKVVARGTSLDVCDDVITALRHQVMPLLRSEHVRRERVDDTFHLAYRAISSVIQRSMARERLMLGRWVRLISLVGNTLSAAFDFAELRSVIIKELPTLGIATGFVVLYEPGSGPMSARMFAAFDRGGERNWPRDMAFDPKELLPPGCMRAEDAGRSFAVMPLMWKQESLGHVLLELDNEHGLAYGAVASGISNGIFGARLRARGA